MPRVLGNALTVLVMLQPMALCVLNVGPWTWCLTTYPPLLFWHTAVNIYTRQGMNRLLDLIIPSYEALIVKEGGGGDGNSYIPPATSLCSSPASSHYKSQSQRLL